MGTTRDHTVGEQDGCFRPAEGMNWMTSDQESQPERSEHRMMQRLPLNLMVGIELPDGFLHTAELTDVGVQETSSAESSVGLLTETPLTAGTSVLCSILDGPGNPQAEFQLLVKWCRRQDDGRYAVGGTITDAGGRVL